MLLSFCHTLLHISVNIIACGESILQNFFYYNFYLFFFFFFIIIIICMNIFLSIFVLECFIMPNRIFYFLFVFYIMNIHIYNLFYICTLHVYGLCS